MEKRKNMKVTITLELRFDVMPDGSVWTLSNFHESFWDRYLAVYEQVEIVARANSVTKVSQSAKRVDSYPKIIFKPLPFYIGPIGYLKKWMQIRNILKSVEQEAEAVVLRVGSPIADILQPILLAKSHPYAVEVVGDPHDTFAPRSVKSLFRPFYRWWFCRKLKEQAKNASGASYVTSTRLPERYPATKSKKIIYASSIELLNSQISESSKNYTGQTDFKLICVGALEDWRKGPDTALRVLSSLRSKGLNASLIWVGDGRNRIQVEKMALDLGLSQNVNFKGHLPSGDAIFKALDEADIFILPTRGEGLPRAMIEAMARGLVCVGSDVGGIPELLSNQYLHDPEDTDRLTLILDHLMRNTPEMNEQSLKNWTKAHDYLSQKLQERRSQLYSVLKGITNEWKKNTSSR
jgi:glycosyltransferase involved in cell wall biosynthesis